MLLVLLFTFLLVNPHSLWAQDSAPVDPTIQARNDYLYQYSLYNTDYITYTNKKQTDSQYNSITTKNDKFTAGRLAIISRNRMLRTYLAYLRLSLNQFSAANPTATQKYQAKLADWEQWLDSQGNTVLAINNESDLSQWAQDYQPRYRDIQQTIYSSLIQHQTNHSLTILTQITGLADTIKTNPSFKPEGESWLNEINIKSNLVHQSLNNAFDYTQRPLSSSSDSFSNFYPDATVEISHAKGYLIDMKNDLWATLVKYFQP